MRKFAFRKKYNFFNVPKYFVSPVHANIDKKTTQVKRKLPYIKRIFITLIEIFLFIISLILSFFLSKISFFMLGYAIINEFSLFK